MSIVERKDKWWRIGQEDASVGEPEPIEESVLGMFLYVGITDFLEAHLEDIERIDNSGSEWADVENMAAVWVDEYAQTEIARVPDVGRFRMKMSA
jgi:hypothetical protein